MDKQNEITGQLSRTYQPSRSGQRMFSASDDRIMIKQIRATHTPDGREINVKPILSVIENILNRSSLGTTQGTRETIDTLENRTILPGFDGILEPLACVINRISNQLSGKCPGGGDAHATTMAIFHELSNYSWEAKVVIFLAAFAANYGEFYLIAQLYATNPLAKSVALLKQLPDIKERFQSKKSQFDLINELIRAILDVTKCIPQFNELLLSQYISEETPPLSVASAYIPAAAYWTIRSMVICMSQITSLLGMSYHDNCRLTTEAWEISCLTEKVSNIRRQLKDQLGICNAYIDGKKYAEFYDKLVSLFKTPQSDNIHILKRLIYLSDDLLPLVDGTTKRRVNIEVLRRKTVLLLISDLDLPTHELEILVNTYREQESHYEMVWLPIVDRSIPWNEAQQQKFEHLQSEMPWHSVHHPLLLQPVVAKFIKDVWHFSGKTIVVVLDQQGNMVCQNAFPMIWIWGHFAFPFTPMREKELWETETWKIELLLDGVDPSTMEWILQGKCVCLYGGEDIEWIRKFTKTTQDAAKAANIPIEMVYVGKNNARERVQKINDMIAAEQLSHCWTHHIPIWFFWARLESMLYSKIQHGKTPENDPIMNEVWNLLGFGGCDQGWAIIGRGNSHDIARAKGDTILKALTEFVEWKSEATEKGFIAALNNYLHKLHSPQHCNCLRLPMANWISGGIPERMVCTECGRPMEKYIMYCCCTD